jgi:hypothetical protein
MKRDEFNRWFDDYCGFFPGLLSWMNNEHKVADAAKLQDGWFRRLQRFDYLLLGRVTNGMLNGEIDPIQAVDYPLFAHHIASAAGRLIDRDRRAQQKTNLSSMPECGHTAMEGSTMDAFLGTRAAVTIVTEEGREDLADDAHEAAMKFFLPVLSQDSRDGESTLNELGISLERLRQQMAIERTRPVLQPIPESGDAA